MKKRIAAVMLCLIMVLTSIPLTGVCDLLSFTAQASSIEQLNQLFQSIPTEDQWDELFISTSFLKSWYDQAKLVLESPDSFSDAEIDRYTANLQTAYDEIQYHTRGIALNKTSLSLGVDESETLRAILNPENAADAVVWTSSGDKYVSVNSSGVVTVLKYSKDPVTVTAKSNNFSASCKVTTLNPLAGVTLSETSKTIYSNATLSLKATAVGRDNTADVTENVMYIWDSSNEDVAFVTDDGLVVANKAGTTVITVTAKGSGGTYSAKCTVKVDEIVFITSLKANTTTVNGTLSLTVGESETFKVAVSPTTASIKKLKWTSSNTDVASVSDGGVSGSVSSGIIKALKEGTTTITYAATDGSGLSGKFTVKVLPLVSLLSLSETSKVITMNMKSETISATVLPTNAGNQVLSWTSSDLTVCSVDYTGKLTPVGNGTCVITAKTTDGSNLSASCTVTVASLASSVSLNKSSASLKTGETVTLSATVKTTDGSTYSNNVEWVSSNAKVASVSDKGVVTAKYPGTATIKAITIDGTEKTASCTVTVTQSVTGVELPTSKTVGTGQKITLTASVKPSYASNTAVTWSSSDTSIATVSSAGVVTAGNKVGSCKITVTTVDGKFTAECTINVVILTTSVSLNKTSATLEAGSLLSLKATVLPDNATDKTVTWKTSNSAVARVNSEGVITAVAGGKCTITCTASGGQTATCTVSVTQDIESISLNKTTLTLYSTESYTLVKAVTPSTATVTDFTWTSSNKSVATVSSAGVVTAISPGETVITVKGSDKTASCVVVVTKKISVTGISIQSSATVDAGETLALTGGVSPSNASNKKITWKSNNTSVVTVSSSGVITGIKGGSAVITATSSDGGYTATCNVKVNQNVTSVRLNKTSERIAKGKSITLYANVLPTDASDKSITWTSSNTAVAKVSQNGVVTAVGAGVATITVVTKDGGFSDLCNITVYTPVSGVKLSASTLKIPKGETRLLTKVVSPSNATDTTVTWSSSDTSVATVNAAGQVTGKKIGTAVISIRTTDGGFKATCTVSVVQLATSITIDYSSVTINAGKTKTLSAKIKPSTTSDKTVKWSSSDKTVATVSSKGLVKALKGGTAVITAKSGDGKVKATCKITVLQPATSISLSAKTMSVHIGNTKTLTATLKPSDATNRNITWKTGDKTIATVSSKGVVKGVKKGKTTITAYGENGQIKATCTVTVTQPAKSVSIDKTSVRIAVGKTTTLTPIVKPTDTSDKSVTWSSNNLSVATVSSKGVVTAKGVGYAEITVKTKDGGHTKKCSVTVIQPVKGITLNAKTKTLDIDETATLTATVSPKDATNPTVKWTSSDKTVAKVSSSGKVTALKAGTAVITAKTSDGGYTAKCTVTVLRKVRDVSVNKTSMLLYLDKTATLKATVVPSNATIKTVTWTSSNEKVVRVSSKGVLTPVAPGTATVTVKTTQGGLTAKCTVKVERAVSTIKLSKTSVSVKSGSSYKLTAALTPANATDKTITWTSSNAKVATVSGGTVKAVGGGTAVITAKTSNGLTAKCTVNVLQSVKSVYFSSDTADVYTGSTVKLNAVVSPSDSTDKSVTYSTSNKAVATVSSNGTVTGVKAGTATITVKTNDGGYTAKCTVTVLQHVTGVKLSASELEVAKGSGAVISATVLPADATNKNVTWSSSDEAVLKVSQKGEITALANGTALVTVTTSDKSFKASCTVTVFEPVTGVSLDCAEKTLFNAETLALTAAVSPSDASNKLIKWKSSDAIVASVSSNGTVTALRSGTAVITAETVDGGFTASCKITVLQKATGIKLDSDKLVIDIDSSAALTATVLPSDCYDKAVTWSSENEELAVVDENGVVTALKPGEVKITATSVDGGFTASCLVICNRPVTGITLSETEHTIYKDASFKLEATVLPEDASDKTVIWASSDELVAVVNENGEITGVGKGTAVITARTADGDFIAVCNVEVIIAVSQITISESAISVNENDTFTLTAEALPEAAENKNIIWVSSDESTATVADGVVTGVQKGETVIKAVSEENPEIFAECTVNVTRPVTGIAFEIAQGMIYVGDSMILNAVISPEDASDKAVTWTSSDESVATVTDGIVTGISRGNAVIFAESRDGGFKAEYSLEVRQAADQIVFASQMTEIARGDSTVIQADVLPENTNNKALIWSSADESIAVIDENTGKVTGVAAGEVVITAKAQVGDAAAVTFVRVIEPASAVEIIGEVPELWVGDTVSVSAAVLPEEATYKDVTWTSSDDSIVTVSDGTITAVSAGQAVITVTSHCEKASTNINVTVKQQVTGIELDREFISIDENSTQENGQYQLNAVVLPENAFDKTLTWTSADSSVAVVNENGLVTAVSKGETVITATSADGRITAECAVKVVKLVTGIDISAQSLTIEKNKSALLAAAVIPADATDTSIRFVSGDESIATVDENGNITAHKAGSTVISVLTSNENVTAQCQVNVEVYSESITLDVTEKEVWKDDTLELHAVLSPQDVTNKDIIWTVSDDNVLSVDENGMVTALSDGEAVVTATAADTGISASCKIKVSIKVQTVSVSEKSVTLKKGESIQVQAEVLPENATYKDIVWISSDEKVAVVNENASITAVGVGTATITARTVILGVEDILTVTVTQAPEKLELESTAFSLDEGESKALAVSFYPSDTTEKDLIWESSDESIAQVCDATIKAVSKGKAIITAKSAVDESVAVSCELEVIRRVSGVDIKADSREIYLGSDAKLEYEVLPSGSNDERVKWSISDEYVAVIDENGVITPKNTGTAIVSIWTLDGGYGDYCIVNVKKPITSITLDKQELLIDKKATAKLTASYLPEDADSEDIIWISENSDIVTVKDGIITAGYVGGTATVKAVSKQNAQILACCTVTVREPVATIALSESEITLRKGDTRTLDVIILPENATDKTIAWQSSDESIATVDDEGRITAVSSGEAVITVTSLSDEKTASCTVKVLRELEALTLTAEKTQLTNGEKVTVSVEGVPEQNDEKISFSSSDENVITVDENGSVTAVSKGQADVIAMSDISGMTARLTFEVIQVVEGVRFANSEVEAYTGFVGTISYSVYPENATNSDVVLVSSDESVVRIAENAMIECVAAGEAQLTVTTVDGGYTDTCTITVIQAPTVIELNMTSGQLKVGRSLMLEAYVSPDDAQRADEITWTSRDTDIASVSADGTVTAVAQGETVITARTWNGLEAKFVITVI